MTSTYYNLSDEWGWYVDIESMKPIYQLNPVYVITQNKKINYHFNKLETIEEDEYEYFIDNQKNVDQLEFKNINDTITSQTKYIFSIGSTAMITAVFTFVIFFIL